MDRGNEMKTRVGPARDIGGVRSPRGKEICCTKVRGRGTPPTWRALTRIAVMLAATACPAAAASFDEWAEGFAAQWVRLSPREATTTQYFGGAEQTALDRELDPSTMEQRQRFVNLAKRGIEELKQFAVAELDPVQRVSAATIRSQLERTVANAPYARHTFTFRQFGGLHTGLVDFLTERHPLRAAEDFENYLARLGQVARRIDEGLIEARVSVEAGLLPPRYLLDRSLNQLEIFLAAKPEENVFVTALMRRGAEATSVSQEVLERTKRQAIPIVTQQVIPAYQRVHAFLEKCREQAPLEGGLSRMPDGAGAYARALATYTTTALTADEIHALGRREVARIEAEQDAVLKKLGHTDGPRAARLSAALARPALPSEPDPRAVLLKQYAEIIRDAERRSEALFNLRPKAPIEVRRVPLMREQSAAASYTSPAPDGSMPGIFWVPLRGTRFFPASRSLAYHEGVPGHHFQIALMQELKELPRYRALRVFGGGSVHSEGWALYTERLAIEAGWYDDDPRGHLVALGSLMFRARRLVVDSGLHAKQWTRQQAIDYGISAQEVERYVAWPGQACSYMVGMLRIVELREKARAALGAKFTLPAFHDVVLRNGSVPLDVLEEIVNAWVAGEK